jgi:hypothetical protein
MADRFHEFEAPWLTQEVYHCRHDGHSWRIETLLGKNEDKVNVYRDNEFMGWDHSVKQAMEAIDKGEV